MIMATYIRIGFGDELVFALLYYKSTEIYHIHIFIPREPTNIRAANHVLLNLLSACAISKL